MLDAFRPHDLKASAVTPLDGVSRPPRGTGECACLRCPVQEFAICGALHGSDLVVLGELAHNVHTKHNVALIHQDEPAEMIYVLTDGIVRLYKTLLDGRRQIVGFALPGDPLGLAVDGRNAYSAEALGDVVTCCFSRKAFSELLDIMPPLLRRLHATVAHELAVAQSHLMLLGHYSARQKLAAFLLHTSERWRRVNGVSAFVPLPMPRQDIGDYLGLTIETVSRTMSLLAREKLIVVVPDGVRILDGDGLVAAAGE